MMDNNHKCAYQLASDARGQFVYCDRCMTIYHIDDMFKVLANNFKLRDENAKLREELLAIANFDQWVEPAERGHLVAEQLAEAARLALGLKAGE